VIKKRYIFVFIVIAILNIPFLIRFLIITQKSRFINNIYFNFPGIINNKKKCLSYDELLNKSLDQTFSASIIDENGSLISSYNEDILRIPASNLKLFSTAYVLSKYKKNIKKLRLNPFQPYKKNR